MADALTLHAVVFRVGSLMCGAPAGAMFGADEAREEHQLLGQARRPDDEGAVLVLTAAGKLIGLEVGEVRDFLSLPASAVASRERLPGVDPAVVRAVGRHEQQHFIILDLDALCSPVLSSERAAST